MNRKSGFTLLELILTIALATIIITIGVPSFQEIIRNNRLTTQTNDLVMALNLARSEAIKRGTTVSICKSSNGTQCNANGCSGGAGDSIGWSEGWLIFVNNAVGGDVKCVDAGEEIIQVHGALPSQFTLNPNNNFTNFISYKSNGDSNNLGAFAVCYDDKIYFSRTVIVNSTGRIRVGDDSDHDGIPEKDGGAEITSCTNP